MSKHTEPTGKTGLPAPGTPEWDAEWRYWLDKVASYHPRPRPHDLDRARRFALVSAFGTIEQYHTDALFHARIHAAEQLLRELDAATPNGREVT